MREGAGELADRISKALGISAVTASVLVNRGITSEDEAERFMRASLDDLVEPFLMSGMDRAVERLLRAVRDREKVLIFGDYDADGVTSTSLLYLVFRELGISAGYHIPERESEGYGLNVPTLKTAREDGYSLVVTVDCGISSVDEVRAARSLGLDVIITDHHEPPDQLPDAYATINPHVSGSTYPFKGLAGVGVAMKLAQALFAGSDGRDTAGPHLDDRLHKYLDIVALGTVADVVPLVGENRILVKHGLELMRNSPRLGIRKLMEASKVYYGRINAGTIGFQLAPRLNASGRIGNADRGVVLLTTDNEAEAEDIASELDGLNRERQKLEADILAEAKAMLEDEPDESRYSIVLSSDRWHQGVIGIVASRLVEEYYKPTVLVSLGRDMGKASARSIAELHLYETLQNCSSLLEGFGGHKYAAGLSICSDMVEEFRDRFDEVVAEMLGGERPLPSLKIDVEMQLDDLDWDLYAELAMLAPFGVGNPEPVLMAGDVEVRFAKFVGRNHVKMKLGRDGSWMDAIAFNMGDAYQSLAMGGVCVDAAFCLNVNEFRGERTLQLNIKDIHFQGEKCSA